MRRIIQNQQIESKNVQKQVWNFEDKQVWLKQNELEWCVKNHKR